jgi:ADP-ribose pyrophosphatase
LDFGHSPLPLCPKSKTEKEILKFFKTISTAVEKKKRNTSANNEYPVTAFIQKPPPKFFFRSASEKLRILVTISDIETSPIADMFSEIQKTFFIKFMKKWVAKKIEYILDSPWLKIRKDRIELNQKEFDYYIVEENNGGVVGALNDKNELLFIKDYRHGIEQILLTLPSGYYEGYDKSKVESMRRELLEETGYYANEIVELNKTFRSPGRYTQELSIFFARNLEYRGQNLDEQEDIKVVPIKLDDAIKMVDNNEIQDLASVTAIMLIAKHINR